MKRTVLSAVTALLFAFAPFILPAQISITASGTLENFNAMSTGTTLPANWKMSSAGQGNISGYTTGTNLSAVTQVANSGSPTAGGAYNWGTTAGTDRAIGFMTDGSYASPNSVMAYYRNTTGATLTTLTVTFQVERYRINTATFSLSFSSSLNGSTWTAQPAGDIATTDFATGSSAYTFTTPQTIAKTVTITGLSLANNSDIYLRWVFTNTGNTNAQGIGLDEVQVAVPPVVTATLKDVLSNDVNSDGFANPGDGLTYATTIKNAGPGNATNVILTEPAPTNTTLVPGSVKTSALARNDTFATAYNTTLNGSTVLANDFGMPVPTVLSFGPTPNSSANAAGASGTTDMGGTLSVLANGNFTYTPATNFSGADRFAYKAGNGNLPNNDGFVLINVAPDITFTTVNVNPLCNGGTTGSITINASGGTGTLTYSKDNGVNYQPSNVFTGLAAGTYNLAVKDAIGYVKTGMATLIDPAAITFTTTNVDPLCNAGATGSITITATGGTGTLTYSKDNGVNYQASNVFSGLVAGTYNLVVKDANNCTKTGSVTLNNPAAISFTTSVSNVLCNGGNTGSITVTASGGVGTLTYSKDNGANYQPSNVFPNLTAATYNVVVKDANNCTKTGTVTVTQPAQLVINSGTIPNLVYSTAIATAAFTTTGGTGTISWSATGLPTGISIGSSNGQVTGTPTQTGSFNAVITVMDANNCTATKNVSFTVAPKLTGDAYNAVGNTQLVADGHSAPSTPFTTDPDNIITNDASDAAITITAVTNATTTNGGTITIAANGKFIYTPKAGSTAADSYVYTATSNGVSATATISFTVANMVWYVNNTNAGTADGRSNTPFTNVASAATASAANDYIYVHTGTGNTTGNAVLKSGQTLRGAGSTLTVGALSIAAGTKPTLSGTVTLANSVTVDGFDMNTGSNTAITSSGATAVNVSVGNVSTNGAPNGVTLTNTTGTVTIAGGSQTNSTGTAFNISGGTANITYGGTISQATSSQRAINIASATGGTIAFNGAVSSTGSSTGINLSSNTGTVVNFTGAITLDGASSVFSATGGGTISATNASSTIGATNVPSTTALNIASTTVGSAGLVFSSVSATSAISGISLTSVTGTGSITINGGVLNSGGGNGVFYVNSGTPVITYAGSVNQTANFPLVRIESITGGTVTLSGNLSSSASSLGISVINNTGGTINFSGATKTFNSSNFGSVSLLSNSNATINFTNGGLNISTASIAGFTATGGGTINVTGTNNIISASNAVGLLINGTNAGGSGITFASITSTSGQIASITTSTGTKTLGKINASSSNAIALNLNNAGTVNAGDATQTSTLTTSTGSGITINATTLNISGVGVDVNATSSGIGVNITGGTVAITGGNLNITTSTGAGLSATSGGTVSLTGFNNTIVSGTGTALNVTNTTIGASGLTFQSISANSSSGNAGIVLDNTGATGGLTVTGTGTTAGSGGTIANKTGADILSGTNPGGQTASGSGGTGIFLRSTSYPSFSYMQLNDFTNFAIYGNNITGFNLANSTINGTNGNNNAGNREESAIRFDNLTTSASFPNATITSNTISGGADGNVLVYLTAGTLDRLSMANNTFGLIGSGGALNLAGDNIDFTVYNSAIGKVSANNNFFNGTRGDFFEAIANNNSTMDVICRQNKFSDGQTVIPGGGTAISIRGGSGGNNSSATTTFDVSCNRVNGGTANSYNTVGMFIAKGQDLGSMSGTINNNILGPAASGSNADGLFIRSAGSGTCTVLVQNNTISGYSSSAIHLQNNDGSCTMNASLNGNTVSSPGGFAFSGLFLDNGATATDNCTMNVKVGSTSVAAEKNDFSSGDPFNSSDISINNNFAGTTLRLSKTGSASVTATNVLKDNNLNPATTAVSAAGTITLVSTVPTLPAAIVTTCTIPARISQTTNGNNNVKPN